MPFPFPIGFWVLFVLLMRAHKTSECSRSSPHRLREGRPSSSNTDFSRPMGRFPWKTVSLPFSLAVLRLLLVIQYAPSPFPPLLIDCGSRRVDSLCPFFFTSYDFRRLVGKSWDTRSHDKLHPIYFCSPAPTWVGLPARPIRLVSGTGPPGSLCLLPFAPGSREPRRLPLLVPKSRASQCHLV